ncbi:MAG: hypothetical protein LIP02_12410, partial [Bacteroidales bacterium]|nr:hypothetical protein [Bacteroidales bacterium]
MKKNHIILSMICGAAAVAMTSCGGFWGASISTGPDYYPSTYVGNPLPPGPSLNPLPILNPAPANPGPNPCGSVINIRPGAVTNPC